MRSTRPFLPFLAGPPPVIAPEPRTQAVGGLIVRTP
jgi:hypothetical protein